MKKIRQLLLLIFSLTGATILHAQDKDSGFDGMMRSNGRIYVVIAVILTILVGLILYLIRLDRKLSKLEKEK
ncbi:MAG TPA: hypothetical protein VI461_16830 [Chitinophagaceae bacterium]|nr:hypothetical protein [Chitinophagaceae bacterium]